MRVVGNERLPFDVLLEIFAYYAIIETVEHPTETLLLVCKSWNIAALGRRTLWGQFCIHLAHRPPIERLKKRVMMRLKRSGDVVPLDIELRNLLDHSAPPFIEDIEYREINRSTAVICPPEIGGKTGKVIPCDCQQVAQTGVHILAEILAGDEVNTCSRWRNVVLAPMHLDQPRAESVLLNSRIANALINQTPALASLTLDHVIILKHWRYSFLQHAPNLEYLALNNCVVPYIPTLPSLRFLGLSWDARNEAKEWENQEGLRALTGLTILKLNLFNLNLPLPESLPDLRRLELRGNKLPDCFIMASFPCLIHLTVGLDGLRLLQQIGAHWESVLSRLKGVKLWFDDLEGPTIMSIRICIVNFLLLLTSVENLSGDERIICIILKIIWEGMPIIHHIKEGESSFSARSQIFSGRGVTFRVIRGESWYMLPPQPIRQDIVVLAGNIGVMSPEEDWEDIDKLAGVPRHGFISSSFS